MTKILPSNAGGAGSIPGQEAKIPHASCAKNENIKKKKKKKQYCNKFSEDFKNGLHQKIFLKEEFYKDYLTFLSRNL